MLWTRRTWTWLVVQHGLRTSTSEEVFVKKCHGYESNKAENFWYVFSNFLMSICILFMYAMFSLWRGKQRQTTDGNSSKRNNVQSKNLIGFCKERKRGRGKCMDMTVMPYAVERSSNFSSVRLRYKFIDCVNCWLLISVTVSPNY